MSTRVDLKTFMRRHKNTRKGNLVTLSDSHGTYDIKECLDCGIKGKIYSFEVIHIDGRTPQNKIDHCTGAEQVEVDPDVDHYSVLWTDGHNSVEVFRPDQLVEWDGDNAVERIQSMFNNFNDTLREGEKARNIISIGSVNNEDVSTQIYLR